MAPASIGSSLFYVDDLAAAAAEQATRTESLTIDAIGPETFTYRSLVENIAGALGIHRQIVSVPPALAYWAGRLIGGLLHDVLITREEIRGLMQERLHVSSPPLGETRLTDWLATHRDSLGQHYASELARRTDRISPYKSGVKM